MRPPRLSATVQEQKAQCKNDSLCCPKTVAIHPAGCGIYCLICAKRCEIDRKAEEPHESGDRGLRAAAPYVREWDPQHSPQDRQPVPALGAPHRPGGNPIPIPSLGPSSTSAWWTGSPGSSCSLFALRLPREPRLAGIIWTFTRECGRLNADVKFIWQI